MKWYKHDSNANSDAKLRRVRLKYGMEGYGLYWYCLELIAQNVDKHNLSFELEHDAEIIAADTGIHFERVQEMMLYMVDLGLFEQDQGIITCRKMLKRLDQSMTSNPEMRKLIEAAKDHHDSVMTESGTVMQEVEQTRSRTEKNPHPSDEQDADAVIWETGVKLIGGSSSSRSFLGRLAKDHGKERLAQVIASAAVNRPVDPKAYIVATLQERPPQSTDNYFKTLRSAVDADNS